MGLISCGFTRKSLLNFQISPTERHENVLRHGFKSMKAFTTKLRLHNLYA